ncbi:MAG: carboxypeptidase-like regulatory domain-containing protein [Candidatus Sulfotelmatobacter sp.]
MHIRSVKLALVLLLVVCVGSALPTWAQSTSTGTVAGSVTDPTGAVVAGAAVTLTDIGTNTARTTTTNASGRYIYVDVNPGIYSIAVSKVGFTTSKTENQEVKVGASLTIDLSLQVGGSNVVVEVTSVGNELQTLNATVGNTITGVAIDSLPSLGRDVSTFVELQPGVGPDGAVGGAVLDQSYFTLDGGNNSNDMDGSMNVYTTSYAGDPTGGVASQNQLGSALSTGATVAGPTGVIPTPADSIEEFKVNTAGQTADFNSSAGAEVKIVTKRGTNAWHGTGYEYYKDNNWSSNSWENNHSNPIIPVPSFHYNRYGGAVGGPIIPKEILGGKTYMFFNYEGFNFPNSQTIVRDVPSVNLRNGIITDPVTGTQYNLKTIDPLGIGLNPVVSQIWNKYEPPATAGATCQSLCDGVNVQGFSGNVSLPTTSKFIATRIDHDFSSKWHFMSTYHYFKIRSDDTNQVDIGGFFKGDTLGVPASQSNVPEQAWMWVAALTTNISSNLTNDFHYSFLRNWWAYSRTGDTPQLPGLGGALELFSGQVNGQPQDLGPFNVNTQNTRTRFWDGHDQMFRDDLSLLKGNHLFQFGGTYQHNFNWHQRTDNGGGINYAPVYELGLGAAGSGLASGSDLGICTATTNIPNCGALTAAALGIVSVSQVAFTRTGPNLTLNPPLTPAFDQSTIPYYNVYFTDTWHMKPTFTLTYGLGWTLEMPPVEANGKQVELVDTADQPVSAEAYLSARKRAALLGQVYNPQLGFALVGNTGNGLKYPYNPFYGEFSPRIAAAWSPHFDSDSVAGKIFGHEDTVIRAGYGRQYGRLNGVDLVLVPLLGTGLIQPVQCFNNLAAGAAGVCGAAAGTPSTAFRIGVNGLTAPIPTPSATLPQPDYPGLNAISAGAGEALDPNFRPNQIDSFDLTIQRQLSKKVTLELGYIGRRITHEYQPINLNAVPYMTTKGGQTFSNAYANVVMQYCGGFAGLAGGGCAKSAGAVTPQPFFEKAMNPAYCAGFANCTDAVVKREGGNFATAQVWSLWSDLDGGAGCTGCPLNSAGLGQGFVFGNTMMNTAGGPLGVQNTSGVAVNTSVGYGNYNGAFVSLKMADWKGFTAQSNFTWSKALGTGAVVQASSEYTPDDPFNLAEMYGRQAFDRRYVYNMFIVYQPPFYKGQSGVMGRLLGGWTFGTVFTAGSGAPIELFTSTGDGQEFGAGDNINFFGNENAIPINPITSGHVYSQPDGAFPNIFKAGPAAVNDFRNPILGMDTRDGGYGILNGLMYWNMDLSVKKNIRVAESISLELQGVFANFLNHNQWLDNGGAFGSGLFNPGGWGTLPGSAQQQPGGNRQIEVGLRVRF